MTGIHQKSLLHTSAAVQAAPNVPDFSKYQAKSESANRGLAYLMIGSLGVLSASAAKSTVTEFLATMAASADVLAMAKVELDLAAIPEGKNVIIKWRGKPVFIRHRTADEIAEARSTDLKGLRDPESDEARTKKPEWLVMLGVCTHLGCVPIGEAGDYGGWFCPCHGSHYDICECRAFEWGAKFAHLPHSWTYPQGPCSREFIWPSLCGALFHQIWSTAQPRSSPVRLQRCGGQAHHRLIDFTLNIHRAYNNLNIVTFISIINRYLLCSDNGGNRALLCTQEPT